MKPQNMGMAELFVVLAVCAAVTEANAANNQFTDTFGVDKAELLSVGTNRFWVLAPGHQLRLEGKEDGKPTVLTITVLDETKLVDGVETRVVEEREVSEGQIVEVSRNYYAISERTTDVFYFGEDVDTYKDGKVAGHEGSWLSGVAGARFGLMMPGTPLIGARYQQEVAPRVALDRAEIVSLDESLQTPAGKYEHCLKTEETSGIEKGKEYKLYVAGIGLIQDAGLKLTKHGYAER
jgi:hypothetical protein